MQYDRWNKADDVGAMNPFVYLILSLFMSSVMLAIIFFVAWRSFGRPKHALAWAVAYCFGALQWTLGALRTWLFEDDRLFWVVAGGVAVLVVSFALLGFRLWSGAPAKGRLIALVGVGVWLAVVCFTYWLPHQGLSGSIGVTYGGLVCLTCAALIWRKRPHSKAAELGAAIVFTLFGVSQVTAGGVALMQGWALDQELLTLYQQINFLSLPTGYIGMGLFSVFILASDLSEQMTSLARTDQLTGLLNRRGLEDTGRSIVARARRSGRPLAVALCDLDRFKSVNDLYGHAVGDRVLAVAARFLQRSLREGDHVARVGGEEFLIVLPGSNQPEALDTLERLKSGLTQMTPVPEQDRLAITASFGLTMFDPADHDILHTCVRADKALYQSKQGGRNRISII